MLWDCNIKSSRNSLNRATGKQVAGLLVFLSFCTVQCFLECGCFINSVISKAMLSQCQTCLLLFSYCAELYMPELHIPAMPFTFALFDCPWESRPSVLVLEHFLHSAHSRKASLCSVAIAELRYSHIWDAAAFLSWWRQLVVVFTPLALFHQMPSALWLGHLKTYCIEKAGGESKQTSVILLFPLGQVAPLTVTETSSPGPHTLWGNLLSPWGHSCGNWCWNSATISYLSIYRPKVQQSLSSGPSTTVSFFVGNSCSSYRHPVLGEKVEG